MICQDGLDQQRPRGVPTITSRILAATVCIDKKRKGVECKRTALLGLQPICSAPPRVLGSLIKLEKGGILRKIWRCSTAVRELRQVNHKNSWASPGFHPSRHPLLTPPLWAARGLLLSIFAGEETGPEGSILCPQSHSSELAKVGSKLRQDECRALASLSLSVLTYKRGRRI